MALLINVLVSGIKHDGMALSISKGETVYISLKMTDEDGNAYLMKTGEKAIFGVKKDPDDETLLIKKTVTSNDEINGVYPFLISNTETNVDVGRYYFDCGVKLSGGSFQRPIKNKQLLITDGITYEGDVT